MTQGARSLLNFLRFRGGRLGQCWWKQSRMAEELGCHRSSIVRWVAELVAAGYLESIRRGSTANLYTLRKTCGIQSRLPFTNATSDVANCDIERPRISLSETTLEKEKQQNAAKNPQINLTPDVQAVLHRARKRIERARNPAAYRATIIGIELRLAKARPIPRKSPKPDQDIHRPPQTGPPKKPPEPEWNIRGPSQSGFEQNIADLARTKRLG